MYIQMSEQIIYLIRNLAILFPAFLMVFTFRGFSRAIVAKWMGDETAYQEGFVSLNPLAHVNIAGLSIILLVVFLLGALLLGQLPPRMLYIFLILIGVRWIYPVPFEPGNFRKIKRGAVFTILAGPIGCFLLALIFMYFRAYLPINLVPPGIAKSLIEIFDTTIGLSAYFGVLTFIPIPPFDGGRILEFVLSYDKQWIVSWLEEYSFIILLSLFLLPVVSDIFFGAVSYLAFLIISFLSMLVF